MFLWQWSQRRKRGQGTVALLGAVIGAFGGLLFALIMFAGIGDGGNQSTASVLAMLGKGGALLVASVPAFAWIGFSGANRVFIANEAMYQAMLDGGARVPDQAPVLQASDRGPMIAVIITVVVIAGFIAILFAQYG